MNDRSTLTDMDDAELAELVAEIGERLRRGEQVRPEDYPRRSEPLRVLLPTIKMIADLPGVWSEAPAVGRLDDFLLLREVSHGGMGVVYEAVQVSLGRRVALKILPNAAALDPRHLQRFHLEAQAAASLNHPHIVPVFATGSAEGMPYYAMRFIEGRDLSQVIRELRTDELADTKTYPEVPIAPTPRSTQVISRAREVARLARQAAEALEHAHASDILHRDIKPSNLMIDKSGHLWITDFGLARVKGGLDLTHTGDALGTPRYMSPEQALGSRTPLDGRTDIYSLGVTIYELLTLWPAFSGDDRFEVLRKIAQDEPTPPRKLDSKIPLDFETIVMKAMAKAPADRYATAAELADDLGRFLDNRPILARRPSLADRGAKWMRRHRALIVSMAAGLMILVMGLAVGVLQHDSWLRQHSAALEAEAERADRFAQEAQRHANEADRQRTLADGRFLAAQLRLAQQAIEPPQLEVAQDFLDAIAAQPRADAAGHFAWRYLSRLARRTLVRLADRPAWLGSMAVAGNGQTAAAWYNDSTIVVWDLASELPLRTIGPAKCRNLALSDDGRVLAAERANTDDGSFDQIVVWDTSTGRALGQFAIDAAVAGGSSSVHLLAGGRAVARRWHNSNGKQSVRIHTIGADSGHSADQRETSLSGFDAVCILPVADFFVTREGARVRVRDAFSGKVRKEFSRTFENASDLALSGDGRHLAVALGEGSVVVLDRSTGTERARHRFGTQVTQIAICQDGSVLAGLDHAGHAQVWDLHTGRSHQLDSEQLEHGGQPRSLVFSADGKKLATASWGDPAPARPVAVWDVASGRCLGLLPCASVRLQLIAFSSTNRALIASSVRSPLIWHFDPPPDSPSLSGHKDEAWSVAFSPDSTILATGSDDTDEPQTIKLWDPAGGKLIRGWNGGEGTVASLAFSPDGRILASGHLTQRNNVRLWDVATGTLLHTFEGHQGVVRSVAFTPDGRMLATGGGSKYHSGNDWIIRLWDLGTKRCVRELRDHTNVVRSLAFSPDGRTLATASNDPSVRLWDTGTGRLLQTHQSSSPFVALAFARDGRTIAAADDAGAVAILGASNLDVQSRIRGASDKLLNLAMAPDGRSLATCGISGTIRLWDTLTGQELLVLRGHQAQVNGIAFAPDGSSLASCSHDGGVKLWRAGPDRSAESR